MTAPRDADDLPPRRRRRAVGPPGALPGDDSGWEALLAPEPADPPLTPQDDARLQADRPPHHDRGV